ncbi:MAG: CDP-diacylglycerol--glycerol-3-phosphate 3-phosphatidyltransferase [Merismopediaceae bacterium]|nr:CDP-diacylglycerol--glycerol-3-phosphate 3-phosphatidyltransferase [Merismopediaceae bacterium]
MNLPNTITVSRLLVLPILFVLLADPTDNRRWWATGLFCLAALTDWLDGYLARKLDQVTDLGKFLDPLVDKFLVLGPLLLLIQWQRLPAWAVFLILGRELAIAGWRINPQLAGQTTIVGANLWGKLKTVTQIIAIALLLAPLPDPGEAIGLLMFWLAVVLTLISGGFYLWPLMPGKPSAVS